MCKKQAELKDVLDKIYDHIQTLYFDSEEYQWEILNKLEQSISQLQEGETKVSLREELIEFACRYDKYNLDKIKTIDETAMLKLYRKGHEKSVDEYLKSKVLDMNIKFKDANLCSVCHINYVDSANGFDTCDRCSTNI
jgi:hypothetical protein